MSVDTNQSTKIKDFPEQEKLRLWQKTGFRFKLINQLEMSWGSGIHGLFLCLLNSC